MEIGIGILIGLGLAVLGKAYRPALKGAIKLGMVTSERVKEAAHEGEEVISDLVAEARQEVASTRAAPPPDKPKPPISN
jgi:hypothetical protein